jgi:hypothetical protein
MEDFFKKVDKRAAESAEEVMRKYTVSLKESSGSIKHSQVTKEEE